LFIGKNPPPPLGVLTHYNIGGYNGLSEDFPRSQEQGIIVTGRRDVSGSFDQITLSPGSVANIKGSLVVGKGGINSPPSDNAVIAGSLLDRYSLDGLSPQRDDLRDCCNY